jgi:hypothetical protein
MIGKDFGCNGLRCSRVYYFCAVIDGGRVIESLLSSSYVRLCKFRSLWDGYVLEEYCIMFR